MGVFGYLDAGSGSMIVGAVAAGAAGAVVAAKVGWKRMSGVFGRKGNGVENAATTVSGSAETPVNLDPVSGSAVEGTVDQG